MGHQVGFRLPSGLRYNTSLPHSTFRMLCFVKSVHAYQVPQRSQAFQGAGFCTLADKHTAEEL